MKNGILWGLAITLVMIGLFVAGRASAPSVKSIEEEYRMERMKDSTRKEFNKLSRKLALSRDSIRQLKILSDTWYYLYDSLEKVRRPPIKAKFKNDTARINRASLNQLDSMLRARYPGL